MTPREFARFATIGAAAGIVAAAVSVGGVVAAQAITARNRPSLDPRTAPGLGGDRGPSTGPLLRLVVLGDSIASGVGAQDEPHSLAGRVATALAADGYRVQAHSVAVPNSHVVDVKIQASRALITSEADPYDVALIVVGAMDVCSWTSLEEIEQATYRAVAALTNRDIRVVLATTVDLGSAPCVRQPLRGLWGLRSRKVADAQLAGALEGGAEVVDLVDATGTSFSGDRGLYSEDGFHPSTDGYRNLADAITPVVLQAARDRAAGTTA